MSFLSNISLPVNVLQTIAAVFLLLLLGYALKKRGILQRTDTSVVNTIIIYLTLPAFFFTAIYKKPIPQDVAIAPLTIMVSEFVVIGLAYLAARALKLDRKMTGGLMLAAAFGNTGFLGYPVTTAAWPDKHEALITSVMIDNFGMAFWLNSIGVAIAASFGSSKFNPKRMFDFLKTPMIPMTVFALIVRDCNWIPQPFVTSMRYLAAATVPLAMISIGLSLSASSIKRAIVPCMVCVVLKIVAMPLLAHTGLNILGVTGIVRDTTIVEATMPTAIMAGVVAGQYGADGPFVSGVIFLMTLLSLVTIPVVLTLLH